MRLKSRFVVCVIMLPLKVVIVLLLLLEEALQEDSMVSVALAEIPGKD